MKSRKMKLIALGLTASILMGAAAPAFADDFELSDGFGQEEIFVQEENFDVFDAENVVTAEPASKSVMNEAAQEGLSEGAETGEKSEFEKQLEEDIASEKTDKEENNEELTSEEDEESEIKFDLINKEKAVVKAFINGLIDTAGRVDPAFFPLVGPLKAIFEILYNPLGPGSTSPTQLDQIQTQLTEIQSQISAMENSVNNHMSHVVELNSFGTEFNNLTSWTNSTNRMISNIKGNANLTDEEKIEKIAALYDSTYMAQLSNALDSTTCIFWGDTSNGLRERSLFDAAIERAFEDVMFSGEALDMIRPYIARQIVKYISAYATVGVILNAYDTVHGSGSTVASHQDMDLRLAGVNIGSPNECSILALYNEYFDTYRWIFVDKGRAGAGIKLSNVINVETNHSMITNGYDTATPVSLTQHPLSSEQMQHLAEYAAQTKKTTLFDYLFNEMGFKPNTDSFAKNEGGKYTVSGDVYFATGNQKFQKKRDITFGYSVPQHHIRMQVINSNRVGAGDEQIEVWKYYNKPGEFKILSLQIWSE